MRSLFDKLFARKKNKIAIDGYKVKHGRGDEMNHDLVVMQQTEGIDPYSKAGVGVKNFRSEAPLSRTQKMAYSSVQEEDARKKKEQ